MKIRLVSVTMVIISLAWGLEVPSSELTAKSARQDREKVLEQNGGMVFIGGNGRITIVDTLGTEISNDLIPKAFKIARILHVFMEAKQGTFSFKSAEASISADNAAVFIVEDPGLPITLVAQEARWAVVNVYPLRANASSMDVVRDRLYKSFLRATCLLLGAAPSKFSASPLKPIMSLKDLDALTNTTITFDAAMNMDAYMKGIGIKRYEPMTYRAACEEGVAPPPTNDVQKAIWEKVKADRERGPTNPITIPPPKR